MLEIHPRPSPDERVAERGRRRGGGDILHPLDYLSRHPALRYLLAYLLVTGAVVVVLEHQQQQIKHNQQAIAAGIVRAQNEVNAKIVASQVEGCRGRGNQLRGAVNYDTHLLKKFLTQAAVATSKRHTPYWDSRSRALFVIAKMLKPVPVPNCSKVIYHPPSKETH